MALVRWAEGVYEGHFPVYVKDNEDVVLINTTPVKEVPPAMMFNPPMPFQKEHIKILDIGNSHSAGSLVYLPYILNAIGYNEGFSIYSANFPGASFKDWYDIYNGTKVSQSSYEITKAVGDTLSTVDTGTSGASDNQLIETALLDTRWDVILIHQASYYSTLYDAWGGTGDAGYLKELIQVLRKTNPQATIGFELIHSYRSTFPNNNPEQNSLLRWQHIAEATEKLKKFYGIDFIIPYGTAIQNLRASSLNDSNEFSSDGNHIAWGLGLYTCACAYYQALFAPITGVSILGNSYRNTSLDESQPGVRVIDNTNAPIAQKAAALAVYNMWEVMNPESYNFPFVSQEQEYQREPSDYSATVIDNEGQQEFIDAYQQALQNVYQATTDAQNAKADYVGDDYYIYTWDATQGKYVKTNKYVKGADGAPGTTDYNALTNKPNIPDELKDLTEDSTHRTVTDTEKSAWNAKANAADLSNCDTVVVPSGGTWPF
ncbi:MAG: DUF4886 domain-containing protein [Bacteroidaceae bacterium]|nr:DUF4886 domain-containing protein [Bacteroidaceae bacterium]